MPIKLAQTAGFCMGVRRAVDMALKASQESESPIYTYGALIHNPQTMEMLQEKGIFVANSPSEIPDGTVIIRAHGVTPEAKEGLQATGAKVCDATCPKVTRVQRIIAKHAQKGCSTVIIGEEGHPEVIGLLGYAENRGHVISTPEEADALPPMDQVCVVVQTTQDEGRFLRVAARLKKRYPGCAVFNTLCDYTHRNQTEVLEMADEVDAFVVVGGKMSGNTRRLALLARETGTPTFHVETADELEGCHLERFETVGITAGASTPSWIIEQVVAKVEEIEAQQRAVRSGLAASPPAP